MFAVLAAVALAGPGAEPPPGVADGLKSILAVGREGAGNEAAAAGWKRVVAAGPDALVPTLAAFDTANPTAANWLRTAVDALAPPGRSRDPAPLLAFVKDPARAPAARRIAFELAKDADPTAAAAVLKTLVNDRSVELRRDAIQLRMPDTKDEAQVRELFEAARDPDQCEELAKKLTGSKQPVDLTKHYGLVTEWHVIGPFPEPAPGGYHAKLPPETAAYDSTMTVPAGAAKLAWKPTQSDRADGAIDLNKLLGDGQNVVAYLAAVVESPAEMPAEVRVSTPNAVKVFVNGEPVLAREAYHQGQSRDQYAGKLTLKKGLNTVLVKVCQDNQQPAWAKAFAVSARLCDETGGRLPLTQYSTLEGGSAAVPIPHPLGRLKPAPAPEKK